VKAFFRADNGAMETHNTGAWQPGTLGSSMHFTYRGENRTFQDFGAYQHLGATVTGLAEPDVVPALFTTYGDVRTRRTAVSMNRFSARDALDSRTDPPDGVVAV
jgi:hypothetical protein